MLKEAPSILPKPQRANTDLSCIAESETNSTEITQNKLLATKATFSDCSLKDDVNSLHN